MMHYLEKTGYHSILFHMQWNTLLLKLEHRGSNLLLSNAIISMCLKQI